MKRSSERILTTHIGSLPRPKELWTHISAKDRGQPYDQSELNRQLGKAVEEIVRKQIEVGIDIPSVCRFMGLAALRTTSANGSRDSTVLIRRDTRTSL